MCPRADSLQLADISWSRGVTKLWCRGPHGSPRWVGTLKGMCAFPAPAGRNSCFSLKDKDLKLSSEKTDGCDLGIFREATGQGGAVWSRGGKTSSRQQHPALGHSLQLSGTPSDPRWLLSTLYPHCSVPAGSPLARPSVVPGGPAQMFPQILLHTDGPAMGKGGSGGDMGHSQSNPIRVQSGNETWEVR